MTGITYLQGYEFFLGCLFVIKLKSDVGFPDFITYVGGKIHDSGRIPTPKYIAVDNSGNIYITGERVSTDFPITENAFDRSFDSGKIFILKLSDTGNSLDYSTFLGGSDIDHVSSIDIDDFGNAYITGKTCSDDFPITENAYDTSLSGQNCKCFMTKIDPEGTSLNYSTFLDVYSCVDIIVNNSGEAYITGRNYYDIFVSKINADGSYLIFKSNIVDK